MAGIYNNRQIWAYPSTAKWNSSILFLPLNSSMKFKQPLITPQQLNEIQTASSYPSTTQWNSNRLLLPLNSSMKFKQPLLTPQRLNEIQTASSYPSTAQWNSNSLFSRDGKIPWAILNLDERLSGRLVIGVPFL